MTPAELNRRVARATGETVAEIARRGFQPLVFGPVEPDPEDQIIDWDALELARNIALVEQPADCLAVA
jgi:hypothetical protein